MRTFALTSVALAAAALTACSAKVDPETKAVEKLNGDKVATAISYDQACAIGAKLAVNIPGVTVNFGKSDCLDFVVAKTPVTVTMDGSTVNLTAMTTKNSSMRNTVFKTAKQLAKEDAAAPTNG